MRIILLMATLVTLLASNSEAAINAYVSILPQKYFVESIGKERVNVKVMVMPGASPATYEPKPKQMVALSNADVYFSIGVPFEKSWLNKFKSLNKNIKFIATDAGIDKRAIEKHVHHEDEDGDHHEEAEEHHEEGENHHEDDHHEGTRDPHVWLDPILVIKQAENITKALCDIDPDGASFYKNNLNSFVVKTNTLHNKLKLILDNDHEKHFMVFHPSWGYFADRYHLHQIPVELEGKEPKPSDLREFIELTKELNLKTIFVQPQFSMKAAKLIAHETGAKVVAVDPLAEDWENNLLYASKLISDSL